MHSTPRISHSARVKRVESSPKRFSFFHKVATIQTGQRISENETKIQKVVDCSNVYRYVPLHAVIICRIYVGVSDFCRLWQGKKYMVYSL